jgi:hypothetical protein
MARPTGHSQSISGQIVVGMSRVLPIVTLSANQEMNLAAVYVLRIDCLK